MSRVSWLLIYLAIVFLICIFLGQQLRATRLQQIVPVEWMRSDYPKPCPRCNGEMIPYRVGCRWIMGCSDCGEMMPADEYQRWLERRGG